MKPKTQLAYGCSKVDGNKILVIDCAGPTSKVKSHFKTQIVAPIGKIEKKPTKI